jgi:thiol-disulfide isomerase/thioredoxin
MKVGDIQQKMAKFAGNSRFLVILFLIIIFLIAAITVYRRYVSDRLNASYVANNEFNTNKQGLESVDLYFFYTEWCPHCKTAKPIWYDFKKEMEGKNVKGIKLNFYEVDCDKDSETSDKFNVKGFPTIKMMKGNQLIEYDAKPSKATLHEFVRTSLD